MKYSDLAFVLLGLTSMTSLAESASTISIEEALKKESEGQIALDFGMVLKSDTGEPVGFHATRKIPIRSSGKPSLYGLVVSKDDEESFLLGSVHVVPQSDEGDIEKYLGKQMKVKRRGGIFMKTQVSDKVGLYKMEVYIDNVHFKTIEYELVEELTSRL